MLPVGAAILPFILPLESSVTYRLRQGKRGRLAVVALLWLVDGGKEGKEEPKVNLVFISFMTCVYGVAILKGKKGLIILNSVRVDVARFGCNCGEWSRPGKYLY